MSHFSVSVVVPSVYSGFRVSAKDIESCLHQILAPYDEQTEEEEYREFEDRTDEAKADYEKDTMRVIRYPDGTVRSIYDRTFTDLFYIDEDTIYQYSPDDRKKEQLQTEASRALKLDNDYPVKLFYPDFDTYCDEYRGYVRNADGQWGYTHNPDAKWDWWEIGGRFPGKFLVKEDVEDCIDTHLCADDPDRAPEGYKYADAARKKDISWEFMKQLAVEAVEEGYKRCVAAFESGDLKDFGFFSKITDEGIMGWGSMLYVKGETLDEYKARKGVTDVDKYPISTYAFIDRNGDWSGSGDMGWFAISTNDKEERAWNDEMQTMMNEVQDNDFIVAVDCHI